MDTILDFLTFDTANKAYTIEGSHLLYASGYETMEPYLIVNGSLFPCERVNRVDKVSICCEGEVSQRIGFKATIRPNDTKIIIQPAVKKGGTIIKSTNCHYGRFFPISDTYKNCYAYFGQYTVTVENQVVILTRRQGLVKDLLREKNFLCEVWKKNMGGARKGMVFRLLYHILKLFKRRYLWIVSDMENRADDNGEAFYRYLLAHRPPKIRVVFAIRKESQDYRRLSKIGDCVDVQSFRFKLLFMLCDVNISSHASRWRYYYHLEVLRDVYVQTKYVFLQHGIIKDDLSNGISRFSQNILYFVTSAVPEYNSINVESYGYGYGQGSVWLTGLPRFDRLYHAEKKCITIMPTWRMYLTDGYNAEAGAWKMKTTGFEKQAFYQFYDALINSERLIGTLQKLGYKLQFFPHPIINPFIRKFHHDSQVVFLSTSETVYRDVYAESVLLVTDYSSAVFDFAYLRKPVIYCQFDKEKFYSGEHAYVKGYFDYERDGFGEVVYDLEHTIDLIIEYARGGCVLKDKYRERIDSFFAFKDQNNCQRVLDKIMQIQNG